MKKILLCMVLCAALYSVGISQIVEEKIISSELRELIRDYPDSTRVVIIALKTDENIKELQLKSETLSQYIDIPYNQRSEMALSNKSLQDAYNKLLELGEPFYALFGEETPAGPIVDSTHYYLFMNAFLFRVKAMNVDLIQNLKEVKYIIDGEKKIQLNANTLTNNDFAEFDSPDNNSSNSKSAQPRSYNLLSERSDPKRKVNDVLSFFDKRNNVLRYSEVQINKKLKSINSVQPGDSLIVNIFDDVYFKASISRVNKNINNTVTVRANVDNCKYCQLIISTTGKRTLVTFDVPAQNRYYLIVSDPDSPKHFLIEMDKRDMDILESGPPISPEIDEQDLKDQKHIQQKLDRENKGPGDIANIDVMVVYTPAAESWANKNRSGINNVIGDAMEIADEVLENSQVLINMNLVFSNLVNYVESGNESTDLNRLRENGDGHMDIVHGWRDQYAADLVALFSIMHNSGGRGFLLQDKSGLPSYGFSMTRVQQAANSYTHIHEMGHNMGAHHHKEQQDCVIGNDTHPGQPGPTNWGSWPNNTWPGNNWSAGWRWKGDDDNYYCSVMTYENGCYFSDGITHSRVAYFSSPSVNYEGEPTGHPVHGDNARTIREIRHVIAAYRSNWIEELKQNNWGFENVQVAELHNLGYLGEGVRIGILDTGIDHDHPAVNMVVNGEPWNDYRLNVVETGYVNPPIFWSSKDNDGHGTAVAGTAWQMAPRAEYYIYKITGLAWGLIDSWWFTNAINWMKSKDVHVINHSRSSVVHANECPTSLHQSDITFNHAADQNTIAVNAAGNFFGDPPRIYPSSPGYGENVLSVFSTNSGNNFSRSASPQHPCPEAVKPNLAAPGSTIYTLALEDEGYARNWSGSSFATPHVAGIAAILKQAANNEFNGSGRELIVKSITSSLQPVGAFHNDWGDYQPGRINAWAAYLEMTGVDVETAPPAYVTISSALVGGEVHREGVLPITECGIYWGTEPDVVNTGIQVVLDGGVGVFTTTITGLEKNTTYYVQAYATNEIASYYGEELNFTTPAASNIFVYTAPQGEIPAPIITLPPAIINVLNTIQPNGQPLTLPFIITHPTRSIQTARLYYQNTDSGIFINADLEPADDNTYEFTIPANEVVPGSMNFFVSATDDQGVTVTLPAFQYLDFPFPIIIDPNEPPIIDHTPITSAMVGEVLAIEALVTDPTATIESVQVMYKRHDNAIYSVLQMTTDNKGLYSAELPPITMAHYELTNPLDGKNGLDYVIKAVDEFGAIAYYPPEFNNNNIPQHVSVEHKQKVNFLVVNQYNNPVDSARIMISQTTKHSYNSDNQAYMPNETDNDFLPNAISAVIDAGYNDYPDGRITYCPDGTLASNTPDRPQAYISSQNVILSFQSFSDINGSVDGLYVWGIKSSWTGTQWVPCTNSAFGIRVDIYSDDNGQPGDLIYSEIFSDEGIIDSNVFFGNWDVFRYELMLAAQINITDGWFTVYSVNDPLCHLAIVSSTGDQGQAGYYPEGVWTIFDFPLGYCLLGAEADILYTDGNGHASFFAPVDDYVFIVEKEHHIPGSGSLSVGNSVVYKMVILETEITPTYSLVLSSYPEGAGHLTGAGTYEVNENVVVEAVAAGALVFSHWALDDEIISTEPTMAFSMINEDLELVAHFEDDICAPGWTPVTNLLYNMQVTAQLIIDDEVSLNPDDLIGAFVDGECRGVASPQPGSNGLVFLTIGSNVPAGESVELIIWNSTNCEPCQTHEYIEFENLTQIGTPGNPLIVECRDYLIFDFGQGYTWFSINVNPGSMELNELFAGLSPCQNDRIIGQIPYATYFGTEWIGSLIEINPIERYVMELCSQQQLEIYGSPVNLQAVTLNAGYTWLGYLPQFCLPVNQALGNIVPGPADNDRIIGQMYFAQYFNGEWVGSLTQMCPGKGFVIDLSHQVTLTYPEPFGKDIHEPDDQTCIKSPVEVYPVGNQLHVMTLLAQLEYPDGQVSLSENDVIYAYAGNECRGMARPHAEHNGAVFMNISSNTQAGETITFKAWIDELRALVDIRETMVFESMGAKGSMTTPYRLTFGEPVSIGETANETWYIGDAYPNPFTGSTQIPYVVAEPSKMNMYVHNSIGQQVYHVSVDHDVHGSYNVQFDRRTLPQGVYIYKLELSTQSVSKQKTGRMVIME